MTGTSRKQLLYQKIASASCCIDSRVFHPQPRCSLNFLVLQNFRCQKKVVKKLAVLKFISANFYINISNAQD